MEAHRDGAAVGQFALCTRPRHDARTAQAYENLYPHAHALPRNAKLHARTHARAGAHAQRDRTGVLVEAAIYCALSAACVATFTAGETRAAGLTTLAVNV